MKYSIFISLLFLLACKSNRNDLMTKLLSEQKLLKDSANNINDRIGDYIHRGIYDSAKVQTHQLGLVHTRLTNIQLKIMALEK